MGIFGSFVTDAHFNKFHSVPISIINAYLSCDFVLYSNKDPPENYCQNRGAYQVLKI